MRSLVLCLLLTLACGGCASTGTRSDSDVNDSFERANRAIFRFNRTAYVFAYEAATSARAHDLHVLGNRVFQANYEAGLRVLEFGDLANRELMEIAFFDTIPTGPCCAGFSGAWGVYPYLPSGTIIVSDLTNGLFILSLQ